jgi:CheY-like chemotaxis protein
METAAGEGRGDGRMSGSDDDERPKILIVDDQRANLLALRRLLESHDAEVVEADSGNAALALAVEQDFALALIDVNMPVMDGYEVVELMRGEPRTRTVPVIFLTAAYADETHRLQGYEVGAVDYIEKPIEPLILHTKVRIFLDLYSHRQQLQRATRALAEQALRESERNFRLAMSAGQTVAFRLDPEFRCTWIHSSKLGSAPVAVIGETPDHVFEEETAGRLLALYRSVWAGARSRRCDVTVRSRARTHDQHFDLIVEPVLDGQGRVEALACAAYEITDRVLAQQAAERSRAEAERANDAKTRFLAAASHDLRQPIQAQRLLLHLLTRKVVDPSIRPVLETMGEALDSTERMLEKLMEFAALESGKVTVSRQVFRLDGMVRRIADEVTPESRKKGLDLRVRVFPCLTDTDPVLLERILRNLVGNAIRYTSVGGVLIALRRRCGRVVLAVYDTGSGVPADMQTVIFEEFRQLGNPERDRAKGMGLGLAIVIRTADLLGHRLGFRSQEGRGSVFSVELPCPDGPDLPDHAREPDASRASLQSRILLVEDDWLQAKALAAILEDAGFEVTSVSDAGKALQSVAAPGPDLILSDYRLPEGVSGLTMIRRLRQLLAHAVPAILITGDTQAAIAEEAAGEGCAIVHKPYLPRDLVDAINRHLETVQEPRSTPSSAGSPPEDDDLRDTC